jgi:tetratricopeptide (TPR) repeat protein
MKKIISALFLMTILLSACTNKKEETRAQFTKGISEFYNNRFESAIGLFTKVVEADPENAEAYYFRGSAWFNMKQYDKAIADLDKAISIQPKYAEAYSTKGDILALLQKHDEACASWRKAQELGKPNLRDKLRRCYS